MEPLREALLDDDAWSNLESIGQVDGVQDSPYVRPGQVCEVEGYELEETERSMKGWCQVRRKRGQEEKDVAAETRGWEEFFKFIKSFPYLAHYWRYERWSKEVKEREWTEEELSEEQKKMRWSKEWKKQYGSFTAYNKEVKKWVARGGDGGLEGGDVLPR